MKWHWPIILAIILAVIALRQTSSLQAHRVEANTLMAKLDSLNTDSVSRPGSVAESVTLSPIELGQLEQRAAGVHQLRGDVTLARQLQETLVVQVQKLTEQFHARTNHFAATEPPIFPPGYRPRHELENCGNATPESTMETFFWGAVHGSYRVLQTVNVEFDRPVPDGFDRQQVEDQQREIENHIRTTFARFPGYRIVSREAVATNKVKIGIETAPGGPAFHFLLTSQSGRWKVLMAESDKF